MATRLGSAFRALKAVGGPKLQAPQLPMGRRNLITLSFRMDGLVAMCAKDAIIHYVPQDLAVILAIYLSFKSYSASVNGCGTKAKIARAPRAGLRPTGRGLQRPKHFL